MSIQSRCNDADHSRLALIHNYLLLEGPMKHAMRPHNYTFHHINSINGNAPAYRKFVNGLIDAGVLIPRHIQLHQLHTLKQQLIANNNPNGNVAPVVYADSIDVHTFLSTTPIVDGNMSHLAPPLTTSTTINTTTTTTPPTTATTMSISFHGTKTLPGALEILKHGYDPSKRAGQSYGPGEYHSNSFSTANHYGPYVLANLVLQHNMKSPGSSVFVTNNPINAYHSVTYMLPLFLCCTNNSNPPLSLAPHVFPDIHVPSPVLAAPQSFQQFLSNAIRVLGGTANTGNFAGADHSRLRDLDQLWVENGIKHYLKSQESHSEYSHINPIAGLAPCFVKFIQVLVAMKFVKPRQTPNATSALMADSVDLWDSLVTPPQGATLEQIGQTQTHTMNFSFYGTTDPKQATNILTDGYVAPDFLAEPVTTSKFANVKHFPYIIINLLVTKVDPTTNPHTKGQSAMCPLGVMWVTGSSPLNLPIKDDIDPSVSLEFDNEVDPFAAPIGWAVENRLNDSRPKNRKQLAPNPMDNDVAGYIDKGYRKWVQSGKQPALEKQSYLSTNSENLFFFYVVDFKSMKQINMESTMVRPVYRS